MHAFSKERLSTGKSYWNYVDQNQNKRFIRNFKAALKGRSISTEQRLAPESDTSTALWIEGRFSPLSGDDGVPYGVIYSFINISDQKQQEREAIRKNRVVQAINHNSAQAFVLLDKDSKVLNRNILASILFCPTKKGKECLDKGVLEFVYPEWKKDFEAGIKVARAGGSVSLELQKPDSENTFVEIRFTPVKQDTDKNHMVSIWAFDISDKKQAELEVSRSEEKLRAVFNSSSQTFYLLDKKLNILAFNEPAAWLVKQQFGVELTVGTNALDITAKENLVQFRVETERAFAGRNVQVEKHFSFNGIEYWFDRHINPVRNEKGEIDRITLWSIDITDRKTAEKALKENESKFRKLASLLPVGIYQVDANGNTTYVNDSLQLIIGARLSNILDGSWVEQIHPEDRNKTKLAWQNTSQENKPYSIEYRIKKGNGTLIYVLEQAQPMFNHLGESIGYLGTIIDISEQKRHQKLLQDKQIAENSLKFRSDFLASMSHEIRTPLNGIMGLSEILLNTNLNKEQASKVQNILSASKDLRSIVNDVLNLSELEAGKVVVNNEKFVVVDLIETIAERYNPEAQAKGLALSFEVADEEIRLHTDRRRLTQVLSNLVRNAIKFTEQGQVRVDAKLNKENQLLIEVTDTGLGIPPRDLKKLFQDFSQLQHTTAQNLEGTGLGLSISKKMMELLGGTIGVRSKMGVGSTFWIALPIDQEFTKKRNDTRNAAKNASKKEVKGIRVLLVEDNLINQQAFKIMLQKMGCSVTVLSNGRQAVEHFADATYDIVFMDIQMPIMDGQEATTIIKTQHENTPPIIGLSGNVLKRDKDGKLLSDMDDLLLKPVVSNDIERMIQKWVN